MKKIFLFIGLITLTVFAYGQSNQSRQNILQGLWISDEMPTGFRNSFRFYPETNEVFVYVADMVWGELTINNRRVPYTYDFEKNILTIERTNRFYANNRTFTTFMFIANFSDRPQMLIYFSDGWQVFYKEHEF